MPSPVEDGILRALMAAAANEAEQSRAEELASMRASEAKLAKEVEELTKLLSLATGQRENTPPQPTPSPAAPASSTTTASSATAASELEELTRLLAAVASRREGTRSAAPSPAAPLPAASPPAIPTAAPPPAAAPRPPRDDAVDGEQAQMLRSILLPYLLKHAPEEVQQLDAMVLRVVGREADLTAEELFEDLSVAYGADVELIPNIEDLSKLDE